jgi:hypothetical protein
MMPLSARESEILRHIALGGSNRGIAVDLELSERTVEAHVRNVFEKLALSEHPCRNRRVEAARMYLTGDWVGPTAVASRRPLALAPSAGAGPDERTERLPIHLAYPVATGTDEIMPAATVPLVDSSMRMNPPVERLAS